MSMSIHLDISLLPDYNQIIDQGKSSTNASTAPIILLHAINFGVMCEVHVFSLFTDTVS